VIVNPQGVVLAGPHYGAETILIADLDRNEVIEGKFDLDVTGHYARPDVFRLIVNEEKN
jgi:nitrilase